jgi:hypothetical protein
VPFDRLVVEATTEREMAQQRCPGCGREFVEIGLEVGGRPLTMRSCSNCDTRQWFGPDGEQALDGVLSHISASTGRR